MTQVLAPVSMHAPRKGWADTALVLASSMSQDKDGTSVTDRIDADICDVGHSRGSMRFVPVLDGSVSSTRSLLGRALYCVEATMEAEAMTEEVGSLVAGLLHMVGIPLCGGAISNVAPVPRSIGSKMKQRAGQAYRTTWSVCADNIDHVDKMLQEGASGAS